MKYILTTQENTVLGPFAVLTQTVDGYIGDDILYSTISTGPVIESEVTDDYINPAQIANETAAYNDEQRKLRELAYNLQSDPIFFQWQRGSKTQQDWLDAVEKVKAQYPYKEQA